MNFGARKSLHYYYLTVLSFILIGILSGALYLWKSGSFNLDNISSVYESGLILEDIKTTYPPVKLKRLVQSDRVRDALKVMKNLEASATNLNRSIPVDEFETFMDTHKKTYAKLKTLISYPKQEMIISVLSNKLDGFKSFVVTNRWKTLTRMTNLMRAKIDPKVVRAPGFFSSKKLKRLIRVLNQDIDRMEKITNDSVLGLIDKNDINTRLKALKVEVSMLEKYVDSLRSALRDYNKLGESFDNWIAKVSPEITLKMIKLEKTTKHLQLFVIGLVGFIALSIAGALALQKREAKKTISENERKVIKLINEGLFPLENKLEQDQLSAKFLRELEKKREYFHRRISFGSVFQEALPFSSLLLDSNLNLSWGNDLFYEQWSISDRINTDNITWDYLQQYTNLGENDPVLLALRDGIAGIYQIQIKSTTTGESVPYEMYVSPVMYSGQKRIMIFFYPQRNLIETLANQVKSLTNPVAKSLDKIAEGVFKDDVKEGLKVEFEAAGIPELFEKFSTYSDKVDAFNNEMYQEIEELEKYYYDQVKLVNDLEANLTKRAGLTEETQVNFKSTKQAIIELIELRYKMESSLTDSIGLSKKLMGGALTLLSSSLDTKTALEETLKSFDRVCSTRDQVKELTEEVSKYRVQLVQTIDKNILSIKRNNLDPKLEQSLNTIRTEVQDLDQLLSGYNTISRQLDVMLSKASMIIDENKVADFDQFEASVSNNRNELAVLEEVVNEYTASAEGFDTKVVDSLKNLFSSYAKTISIDKDSMALIDEGTKPAMPPEVNA